jgi:hypothetical protein
VTIEDTHLTTVHFPAHLQSRGNPADAFVRYSDDIVIAVDAATNDRIDLLRGDFTGEEVNTTDWFTRKAIIIRAADCGAGRCRCAIEVDWLQ